MENRIAFPFTVWTAGPFALVAMVVLLAPHAPVAQAQQAGDPIDSLETQLQRLEAEQAAERRRRAEEEAARRARLEEERRAALEVEQEARRIEHERQLQETAEQRRFAEEQARKLDTLLGAGQAALAAKDRPAAVERFTEALALAPGDARASAGLEHANALLHPLCYAVQGMWEWHKLFGKDVMVLQENGSIAYQTVIQGSGNWRCSDPENRGITVMLSAGGFSNEWRATLSPDGSCLSGPQGGCYVRPGDQH